MLLFGWVFYQLQGNKLPFLVYVNCIILFILFTVIPSNWSLWILLVQSLSWHAKWCCIASLGRFSGRPFRGVSLIPALFHSHIVHGLQPILWAVDTLSCSSDSQRPPDVMGDEANHPPKYGDAAHIIIIIIIIISSAFIVCQCTYYILNIGAFQKSRTIKTRISVYVKS